MSLEVDAVDALDEQIETVEYEPIDATDEEITELVFNRSFGAPCCPRTLRVHVGSLCV